MIESITQENAQGRHITYYVKSETGNLLYTVVVVQKILNNFLDRPVINALCIVGHEYMVEYESEIEKVFAFAIAKQKEWHLDTDKKAEIETILRISDWE